MFGTLAAMTWPDSETKYLLFDWPYGLGFETGEHEKLEQEGMS